LKAPKDDLELKITVVFLPFVRGVQMIYVHSVLLYKKSAVTMFKKGDEKKSKQ